MTTPPPAPKGVRGIDSLALLEVGITFVLGLVLFLAKAHDLAEITWVVGGFLVLHRAIMVKSLHDQIGVYKTNIDDRLNQYAGLAEIVDINTGKRQDELRELIDLFFRITEPDFSLVRSKIVGEAKAELSMLANQKRSNSLVTGEYYNWLLPMIQSAPPGSHIWAVSMLLDCEFDDSPEERSWLQYHLKAIARGVIVNRIFVAPVAEIAGLRNVSAIAAQVEAAGDQAIRVVAKERLHRLDPDLLHRLGDGLIAFDSRVVLVDEHSETGTARGWVSMSQEEIRRRRADFDSLTALSAPLQIAPTTSLGGQGHTV
jgi:hypothetical protein